MTNTFPPQIDLTGLSTLAQLYEYDLRISRAQQFPHLAVTVVFKMSQETKLIVKNRDAWFLAS